MKIHKYFTSKLVTTITILALLASCGGGEIRGNKSSTNSVESTENTGDANPSSTTSWTSFSTTYKDYQTAIDALIKGIPDSYITINIRFS
jgi:ABC-type glycerol-3-phosphate transport system substrate-binding protein